MEALIWAAQEQALRMNYSEVQYWQHNWGWKCRMCDEKGETYDELLTNAHNWYSTIIKAGMTMWQELFTGSFMEIITYKEQKCDMTKSQELLRMMTEKSWHRCDEKRTIKQTNKQRTFMVIDNSIKKKEEKLENYGNLKWEIHELCVVKRVDVIPAVHLVHLEISALKMVGTNVNIEQL